jgi:hypothetical protein
MTKQQDCPLCGEPIEDAPTLHDIVKCEKTELIKGRATIQTLKNSIIFWKEGWFELREKLSEIIWHHPALVDEREHAYYVENLKQLSDKKILGNALPDFSA